MSGAMGYGEAYKTGIEDSNKRKNFLRWCTLQQSTVNRWPLENVSDKIDDYEALMTNHFMLGRRSNNTPVINNKEVDVTLQRKCKVFQAATNTFISSNVNRTKIVVVTQHKFKNGWPCFIMWKEFETIALATRMYIRHTTWTRQRCSCC